MRRKTPFAFLGSSGLQLLAKASLTGEFFPLPLRKHHSGVISKGENEKP